MKRPPRLQRGDVIGLIAPAGPIQDRSVLTKAIAEIEHRGYKVALGRHAAQPAFGYLSGTDHERRADLEEMSTSSDVKAIFCLKGGYGTLRLCTEDIRPILPSAEKIFVGFSDVTTLLLSGFAAHGGIVFHGPMPLFNFEGPECTGQNAETLFKMLQGDTESSLRIDLGGCGYSSTSQDQVRGVLWGGSLSTMTFLSGTNLIAPVNDAIVFFEDVDERPYAIDRYLTRLQLSGLFDQARAFIVGDLVDCLPMPDKPSFTAREVILERLSRYGVPIVFTQAFGHADRMCTFPIGGGATLDCGMGIISLNDSPVS